MVLTEEENHEVLIKCYVFIVHSISLFIWQCVGLALILLQLQSATIYFTTQIQRDGKQLNVFERKVYGRILGPVYDNGKENWRILTNNEIYASVKKPTIIETIRLNGLCWFGHEQRMEENRIVCVGLDMYREWKETELYVLVWTCTESGRK
jgi:hypothetical protein